MKKLLLLLVIVGGGVLIYHVIEGRYNNVGYQYVINHLKAPSTATLVTYYSKSEMNDVFKKLNFTLEKCQSADGFVIDAQNSFGAMIRSSYIVFYRNGVPCHIEDMSEINGSNIGYLNSALQISGCGCN